VTSHRTGNSSILRAGGTRNCSTFLFSTRVL